MTALFVLFCIFAFLMCAVFFGTLNYKKQVRRCEKIVKCYGGDCPHLFAIVLGFPLWFIFLPAVLVYELAHKQVGDTPTTWTERYLERRLSKKRKKHEAKMAEIEMQQAEQDAKLKVASTMKQEASLRSAAQAALGDYQYQHPRF